MTVETENLKKFSTYAYEKKISIATVINWVKLGKIKKVVIDGVQFIQVEN